MELIKRKIKEFQLTPKQKHEIYLLSFMLLLALVLSTIVVLIYLKCGLTNQWSEYDVEYIYTFDGYMKRLGKKYQGKEFNQKLKNLKESLSEINKLNKISEEHGSTAKFGLTKFSDLSPEEFKDKMTLDPSFFKSKAEINRDCNRTPNYNTTCIHPLLRSEEVLQLKEYEHESHPKTLQPKPTYKNSQEPPIRFDWRKESYVGPVLNQGFCLSCWAHSVVGVMETMVAIKSKHRKRLSIQELADCSTYNARCYGGNPTLAVEYLCNCQLPITSEYEYPLKNKNGTCREPRPAHGVIVRRINTKKNMPVNDIVYQIWNHGPVVAIINSLPLHHYLGGIIQYHCSGGIDGDDKNARNHVVQIVGYDLSPPAPHFIIRNSWGTDWGDKGYLYVAMNEDFICGIGRLIVSFDVDDI